MLLAGLVAAVHGTAVLFMLTGALMALRWPRVLRLHAAVALTILAVNLAGAPCPLTRLELHLREQAGVPAYPGGFLGHYLFAPLGLDAHRPAVQAGIYTVALGLNAAGYGLLLTRARRRPPAPGPAPTDAASPPSPRPPRGRSWSAPPR